MEQGAVGCERDIRPLFREKDVSSMSTALDLASYSDVRATWTSHQMIPGSSLQNAPARFISTLLLRVIHCFDLPATRAQARFPWPSSPSLAWLVMGVRRAALRQTCRLMSRGGGP
jgi:hypothetical protein